MKRDRLMMPVNKVFTGCMPPMVWTPNCTVRIILIEEVIYTFIIYHTVRVIHPFFFLCEMDLRAILFVVQLLRIGVTYKCACNKDEQFKKIFCAFHINCI